MTEPGTRSPRRRPRTSKKRRAKARVTVEHLDIIEDEFWDRRPWLLSGKPGKIEVAGCRWSALCPDIRAGVSCWTPRIG